MTYNDQSWHGNTGGEQRVSKRVSHAPPQGGWAQRPLNFWDILHVRIDTQFEKQQPTFARWSKMFTESKTLLVLVKIRW